MASYAEYFEKIAYKPKYFLGDRVFGRWNKIPFVGTVGNDNLVSEEVGPIINVLLDLPIKHRDRYHTVIQVKHKDVKKLELWTDEPKASKKKKANVL